MSKQFQPISAIYCHMLNGKTGNNKPNLWM